MPLVLGASIPVPSLILHWGTSHNFSLIEQVGRNCNENATRPQLFETHGVEGVKLLQHTDDYTSHISTIT